MVVTGNLELWAGHECTALRVGERYVDQTVRTGHARRPDDLERFAALGIRSLRYPILWQHVSAAHPDERDWSFTDTSLARLHALDVNVIAGLVHHGGGPRYTSLLDPAFAKGLARHAGAAARRYPWIRDWCPVNEPLTTARFSALYGHWHPHERGDGAFLRALLNEIDAIRLSMRAIRQAIPEARLVQTEDLGRTFSTAELAYQARFDNDRRWLTWDLLAGRVDRSHPLHAFFAEHGLADRLAAEAGVQGDRDHVHPVEEVAEGGEGGGAVARAAYGPAGGAVVDHSTSLRVGPLIHNLGGPAAVWEPGRRL